MTAFLLASRARTETKLGAQAHKLLGCLDATEAEAGELHEALGAAAAASAAQGIRRAEFVEGLASQLEGARSQVKALAALLAEQRAAATGASEAVEATAAEHAAAIAVAAAEMASGVASELERAEGALVAASSSSSAALLAAGNSMAEKASAMAARLAKSQAAVGSQLESIGAAVGTAQDALAASLAVAATRIGAAAEEEEASRSAIAKAEESHAAEAAKRLATERERLGSHGAALRSLLDEVGEARATEVKAQEALAALRTQEAEGGAAAAAALTACSDAVRAAASAQQAAQQDEALLERLEGAATAVRETCAETTTTLCAQKSTLEAAISAQNAGNAKPAATAALEGARKAVDAAAAERLAHVEEAGEALAAQQAGLHVLASQHEEMRAELLKEVMGAVEASLGAQLKMLGERAAAGIQGAVKHAEAVVAVGEASAKSVRAAQEDYAAASTDLLATTKAWGESNDAVAAEMQAGVASAEATVAQLAKGGEGAAAQHEAIESRAAEWAAGDAACRASLSEVCTMHAAARDSSAAQHAKQAAELTAVEAQAVELIGRSDAAAAQLEAEAGVVRECEAALGAAAEEDKRAATEVGSKLEAMRASRESARAAETDAAAAMGVAAAAAAATATQQLESAKAAGTKASEALDAECAEHGAAIGAMGREQASCWESLAAAENDARATAAAAVASRREGADTAAAAHAAALTEAKEAREAAEAAAEAARAEAAEAQTVALEGIATKTASFAGAEESVPRPAVPPRAAHPYSEPFARTEEDAKLREHFEANGDVPLDGTEPLPARPVLRPATAPSTLAAALSPRSAPRSARKSISEFFSARKSLGAADRENAALNSSPLSKLASFEAKAFSPRAFSAMKVPDLRKLCEANQLPPTGAKAELTERLSKAGVEPVAPAPTPRARPSSARVGGVGGLKRPSGLGPNKAKTAAA